MLCLTRRYRFPAAHRLWNPALSEAENTACFGPCVRVHGHNYTLDVTIAGTPNPITGMIMSITELDAIVDETILQHVDHRHLDEDVDFLHGHLSTVENVAQLFFNRLHPKLALFCTLHHLRLMESDDGGVVITDIREVVHP